MTKTILTLETKITYDLLEKNINNKSFLYKFERSGLEGMSFIELVEKSIIEMVEEKIEYEDILHTDIFFDKFDIDIDLLKALSKKNDNIIRELVAKNKNTSAETLEFLSKDSYNQVVGYVASNKNTTTKLLKTLIRSGETLSNNRDKWIRDLAIRNLESRL